MNYEPIDNFLARVRKLNRGAKDMRLSFEEAQLLAINIAELMSQLNKDNQKAVVVAAPSVIDGGTFPKKV